MTNYNAVAQEVLGVTLSFGNEEMPMPEAIGRLEKSIAGAFDLSGITEIWQASLKSNAILLVLYPQHHDIFSTEDPRTPRDREVIPPEVLVKIIVRSILNGVSFFDDNYKRQQGAEQLLSNYPSPIPPSEAPFADGMFGNYRSSEDD